MTWGLRSSPSLCNTSSAGTGQKPRRGPGVTPHGGNPPDRGRARACTDHQGARGFLNAPPLARSFGRPRRKRCPGPACPRRGRPDGPRQAKPGPLVRAKRVVLLVADPVEHRPAAPSGWLRRVARCTLQSKHAAGQSRHDDGRSSRLSSLGSEPTRTLSDASIIRNEPLPCEQSRPQMKRSPRERD
jgi:hypothetical protein